MKHGMFVSTYVFTNGEAVTLCLACKEQAAIKGEGAPEPGDTPCDWCGKGKLKRD